MANLNHLAPELLILILSSTESPKDLHKLISASSACFHAFVLNRNSILLSILRNAVSPIVFREMLAISHVPSLASFTNPPIDPPGHRTKVPSGSPTDIVKPFLEHYFSNREFEVPSDTARIVSMSRLYNMVSRISDEFFSHTSRLLLAEVDDGDSHTIPPPSTTEKTRIQRAFFRYELYAKLFPKLSRDWYSLFEAHQQFSLFICHITPWEIEELSCVHDYLVSLASGYFSELEEQLVHAFLSCPGARGALRRSPSPLRRRSRGLVTAGGLRDDSFVHTRQRSQRSISPSREKNYQDEEEKYCAFDHLELEGLSIFEKGSKRTTRQFIRSLTYHGIEFALSLMDGDDKQRKNLIRSKAPFGREYLVDALEFEKAMPTRPCPKTGQDDPLFPNTGYCHSRGPSATFYHQIMQRKPIRELGYVFWDKARLETPNAQGNLAKAFNVSREEINRPSWGNIPSVEERLAGVTIPCREWRKIVESFTSDVDGDY